MAEFLVCMTVAIKSSTDAISSTWRCRSSTSSTRRKRSEDVEDGEAEAEGGDEGEGGGEGKGETEGVDQEGDKMKTTWNGRRPINKTAMHRQHL